MKKLFIALGLFLSVGVLGGVGISQKSYAQVRAEETPTSETTPQEQEPTKPSVYDSISQTAKDTIVVIKEVLNQPIVIGGVSVTLGAILLFVFSKVFSSFGTKRVKALAKQLEELTNQALTKKDISELELTSGKIVEIVTELANSTRNVNVKAKCLALLDELKPIVEEDKKFVEEKVEETKVQLNDNAKQIIEIVNKD